MSERAVDQERIACRGVEQRCERVTQRVDRHPLPDARARARRRSDNAPLGRTTRRALWMGRAATCPDRSRLRRLAGGLQEYGADGRGCGESPAHRPSPTAPTAGGGEGSHHPTAPASPPTTEARLDDRRRERTIPASEFVRGSAHVVEEVSNLGRVMYRMRGVQGDAFTRKAGLPAALFVLSHQAKNVRITAFVRFSIATDFSHPSRRVRTGGDARNRLTSEVVIPPTGCPAGYSRSSSSSRG